MNDELYRTMRLKFANLVFSKKVITIFSVPPNKLFVYCQFVIILTDSENNP